MAPWPHVGSSVGRLKIAPLNVVHSCTLRFRICPARISVKLDRLKEILSGDGVLFRLQKKNLEVAAWAFPGAVVEDLEFSLSADVAEVAAIRQLS